MSWQNSTKRSPLLPQPRDHIDIGVHPAGAGADQDVAGTDVDRVGGHEVGRDQVAPRAVRTHHEGALLVRHQAALQPVDPAGRENGRTGARARAPAGACGGIAGPTRRPSSARAERGRACGTGCGSDRRGRAGRSPRRRNEPVGHGRGEARNSAGGPDRRTPASDRPGADGPSAPIRAPPARCRPGGPDQRSRVERSNRMRELGIRLRGLPGRAARSAPKKSFGMNDLQASREAACDRRHTEALTAGRSRNQAVLPATGRTPGADASREPAAPQAFGTSTVV